MYYKVKLCNKEKSTEILPPLLLTPPSYVGTSARPRENSQQKVRYERRIECFVGLSTYKYKFMKYCTVDTQTKKLYDLHRFRPRLFEDSIIVISYASAEFI